MNWPQVDLVMISRHECEEFKRVQQEVLQLMKERKENNTLVVSSRHTTAKEFMAAVRIKRTKFDSLVQASKIRIIRKGRKIYLTAREVDRYFNDQSIQ